MAKEKLASAQIDVSEFEELASRTTKEEDFGAATQRDYVEAFLGSVLSVVLLTAVYTLPGLILVVLPIEVYIVDRVYGIFRDMTMTRSQTGRNHREGSVTQPPAYRPATK